MGADFWSTRAIGNLTPEITFLVTADPCSDTETETKLGVVTWGRRQNINNSRPAVQQLNFHLK